MQQVAPLAHHDHGRVRARARRVDPNHNRRVRVLVPGSLGGLVHQLRRDELVVARAWELPVHLDAGLRTVAAVLRNDLLVDRLVRVLDVAGVNVLRMPELPLGMETLEEIALVAPRVAKRHPKAVRRVLCEEALGDVPDWVRNA